MWVWEWNCDNKNNDHDCPIWNGKIVHWSEHEGLKVLPVLSFFGFMSSVLAQPKSTPLTIILPFIVIGHMFLRNCYVQGVGYILWAPQEWIKRDVWPQRSWHLSRKMTAICKYLNQNGDCLEMGYGNSRGPKLTSGRETIGKKRRKGNRLFYRV